MRRGSKLLCSLQARLRAEAQQYIPSIFKRGSGEAHFLAVSDRGEEALSTLRRLSALGRPRANCSARLVPSTPQEQMGVTVMEWGTLSRGKPGSNPRSQNTRSTRVRAPSRAPHKQRDPAASALHNSTEMVH